MSRLIRFGHPAAFILFAACSFVVAVIASTLVTKYNSGSHDPPSQGINNDVRFLVFAGWWGFATAIVYVALFLTSKGGVITSIAGHAIYLGITWVFWLAGAAALTDSLHGGVNCSNSSYEFCNSLEALIAFGFIGWVILTLMLVAVGVIGGGAFKGGRSVKEGLADA